MRAFVIAGEASGDKLGGALMHALRDAVPDITFDGVGGDNMIAAGLTSRFPMSELSVMGIAEVLPKYFDLKARIDETAKAVISTKPDVLITIDSPDFCLRVARQVRAVTQVRSVHYVAPSVWAWRPRRAAKMAKSVDQVLALLPFEPPFFEAVGLRCDFVGHPIASEPSPGEAEVAAFRASAGLGDAPYLLALPGSRRMEIDRLAPIFGDTLSKLAQTKPGLRVVLPAAPGKSDRLRELTQRWPGQPHIFDSADVPSGQKRAAFKGASIALAASGTVSLELAATSTPMVIAYDMNWFSWRIMSSLARTDTVTLVNLVSETRAVPEFLGPDCTPPDIAAALSDLITDAARRQAQQEAMATTMTRLGQGGPPPASRAAYAILDGLG